MATANSQRAKNELVRRLVERHGVSADVITEAIDELIAGHSTPFENIIRAELHKMFVETARPMFEQISAMFRLLEPTIRLIVDNFATLSKQVQELNEMFNLAEDN